MKLPLYQIDAFADRLFTGNPAAVCLLPHWLPDETLAAIAAENNLSETAFVVEGQGAPELRWFTPTSEMDLCGHATLAAAFVLLRDDPARGHIAFQTRAAGTLTVTRNEDELALDLPSRPPTQIAPPSALAKALPGAQPLAVWRATKLLALFATEAEVRALRPDFRLVAALDGDGLIATAPGDGDEVDFVSRYFAPHVGIDEDPVTGSAHCTLTPFWAARLGRDTLHARQISTRGGALTCTLRGDRVELRGRAVSYLSGTITVPVP